MKKMTSPEQTLRIIAGIILEIAEDKKIDERKKKTLRSIKKYGYILFDNENFEPYE